MFDLIQGTANYSNAVLVAIMPYVSDFAEKAELSIPLPVTTNHVERFAYYPVKGDVGGALVLTNGYTFVVEFGHVKVFFTPKTYFFIQDRSQVARLFGQVRLSEGEALNIARAALGRFEADGAAELLEQEPRVSQPPVISGNTVPRYQFEWKSAFATGAVEVDATNGAIQMMRMSGKPFMREPPKVDVVPPLIARPEPAPSRGRPLLPFSVGYSNAFLRAILPQMSDYASKLELPVETPFTVGMVDKVQAGVSRRGPVMYVELTNRFRFFLRGATSPFSGRRMPFLFQTMKYRARARTTWNRSL